jgi:hypothetical protein
MPVVVDEPDDSHGCGHAGLNAIVTDEIEVGAATDDRWRIASTIGFGRSVEVGIPVTAEERFFLAGCGDDVDGIGTRRQPIGSEETIFALFGTYRESTDFFEASMHVDEFFR